MRSLGREKADTPVQTLPLRLFKKASKDQLQLTCGYGKEHTNHETDTEKNKVKEPNPSSFLQTRASQQKYHASHRCNFKFCS